MHSKNTSVTALKGLVGNHAKPAKIQEMNESMGVNLMIKQLRQMLADLPDDIPVRFEFDINGTSHNINIANYMACLESSADNITELVLRKKHRFTLAEMLSEMPHIGKDNDFAREQDAWDKSPPVGKEILEGRDALLLDDETVINFMLDQLNDSINRTCASVDNSLEFVESSDKRITQLQLNQETNTDAKELNKSIVMLIKETAEARQELIEALKEVDSTVIELRQRAAKKDTSSNSADLSKALKKTVKDNPVLPVQFIKYTLLAVGEEKSGQISKYKFGAKWRCESLIHRSMSEVLKKFARFAPNFMFKGRGDHKQKGRAKL